MYARITAPLANFRSDVQTAEFHVGFGDSVALTRDICEPDGLRLELSEHQAYILLSKSEVFCLTLLRSLDISNEAAAVSSWGFTPQEDRMAHQLEKAANEVVTAMRLIKPDKVWAPATWTVFFLDDGDYRGLYVSRHDERWVACEPYFEWGHDVFSDPPGWTRPYVMTSSDVAEVQKCLDALTRRPFVEGSSIDLALRRFNTTYDRPSPEDQLVDLFIALEALFMNEGEKTEIREQLSTRAGFYLETTPTKIAEIKEDVRNCYRVRSDIVHGRRLRRDVKQAAKTVEEIVRRSLRRALSDPQSLAKVRELVLTTTNGDEARKD